MTPARPITELLWPPSYRQEGAWRKRLPSCGKLSSNLEEHPYFDCCSEAHCCGAGSLRRRSTHYSERSRCCPSEKVRYVLCRRVDGDRRAEAHPVKHPPVPVGARYPGAGRRIRLCIPSDGRNVKLSPLDGTNIHEHVGDVIERVAGLLVAGHEYPLFQERILECWVREARPEFLKIDLDPTTIICASTLKTQERDRLLQAVLNSYRLSLAGPHETFAFIPIVKAGIFREVIYYVEAPNLPDVVFPDLVMDALELCLFLIAGPDSPAGLKMRRTLIQLCAIWRNSTVHKTQKPATRFPQSFSPLVVAKCASDIQ